MALVSSRFSHAVWGLTRVPFRVSSTTKPCETICSRSWSALAYSPVCRNAARSRTKPVTSSVTS